MVHAGRNAASELLYRTLILYAGYFDARKHDLHEPRTALMIMVQFVYKPGRYMEINLTPAVCNTTILLNQLQ